MRIVFDRFRLTVATFSCLVRDIIYSNQFKVPLIKAYTSWQKAIPFPLAKSIDLPSQIYYTVTHELE